VFACLLNVSLVHAQTSVRFVRVFGDISSSFIISQDMYYAYDVNYNPTDSGYLLSGLAAYNVGTFLPQMVQQMFVVRTDKYGFPHWIIGLDNNGGPDYGYGSIFTSDGNIVVVGTTRLGGSSTSYASIVKLSGNGNSILWAKYLSSTVNPLDSSVAIDVIEHSSGNYIVVGYDSTASNLGNGLVFAVDPSGNMLWHSSIGTSTDKEVFVSVVEAHNGNIIALGVKNTDLYLVEIDPATGNVLTTVTYTFPGYQVVNGGKSTIIKNPAGGDFIIGSLFMPIPPTTYMFALSIDNSFSIQWTRMYQGAGTNPNVRGFDIALGPNNTLYCVATAPPPGNIGQTLLALIALDQNTGNVLWTRHIDDIFTSSFIGAGIDMTPTGPAIAGWHTEINSSGGIGVQAAYQALLVKTDFNGLVANTVDTCFIIDGAITSSTLTPTTGSGGSRMQYLQINSMTVNISTLSSHDSVCVFLENCNGVIDSVKTDSALCFGDTSGYAYYWISNGTPPFTHHLSSGQVFTGDTVGPLPPGTYIDSIVDANGCVLIDTFTIFAPDTVKILLDSLFPPTACGTTDGWIKITVTGGTAPYTISWSNGMTGDSIFGLGQGTYIVTATDANGCFATDTFILNPQNGLSVSVTYSNPLCYGDSTGWIKVTVSGGTPPYTHVWSNGMIGDSIANLLAGTYIDSIYDASGCWIMDTITLVDPPQLVLSVVDSALPSTCGGSDGWIKVQATGGTPPITYTWSNGMTGDSIFGLPSGTYVVTAIDSNGCSVSDTVSLVDPNSPQILGTEVQQPICHGDSSGWIYVQVSGGTPPYTHNWSNGISTNSDTLYNVPAGTYTDTVVDAAGCIAIITVTVPEPDPIQITLTTTDPSSCTTPDGQVVATVSGGVPPYIIAWSTGTIGDTLKNVGPGTYTVYVRDSLGCIDSAIAVLSSPDAPTISISEELISCSPPAYEVSVNVTGGKPPYIVYWGTYDTTILLTDTLPPDTYIVILQDLTGCLAYDTLYLPMPDTVWAIAYPPLDTIAPGDTVQLIAETNGGIWWWSPGEYLNDSLSLTPIAQPIVTTMFYFYSYNAQGCFDMDSVLIVVEGDPIVYFPDYFSPNGDGVNDLFRPVYWGDVEIIWRVYNRWSEIVFEGTESEAWDGTYNGRPQQMDSYVLVAFITPRQGAQKGQTTKIVKNILLIR